MWDIRLRYVANKKIGGLFSIICSLNQDSKRAIPIGVVQQLGFSDA